MIQIFNTGSNLNYHDCRHYQFLEGLRRLARFRFRNSAAVEETVQLDRSKSYRDSGRITRDPMTYFMGQTQRLMAYMIPLLGQHFLITPPSLRWLAQVSRTRCMSMTTISPVMELVVARCEQNLMRASTVLQRIPAV